MTEVVKALIVEIRKALRENLVREDYERTVESAIAAVEAESAREDAVEHAIARLALEAVLAVDYRGNDGAGQRNEARRQLSLLSARNFEVVEIPQGQECDRCAFEYDCFDCQNPMEPAGEEPPSGTRPAWCRSRYGV